MSDMQEMLELADAIEKLAFEMTAPNPYTPQFVMLAIAARRTASERLAAGTGKREKIAEMISHQSCADFEEDACQCAQCEAERDTCRLIADRIIALFAPAALALPPQEPAQPSFDRTTMRDALIGLNDAIDLYWNEGRTDGQVKNICYWQFKAKEAPGAGLIDNPRQEDLTMFSSKRRIAELEKENAILNDQLRKWEADWSKTQRQANQVEYLVRTIRDMDEQIYKMNQCASWAQMQPHFNNLAEGMTVRKRAESDRIGELIRPELIKTYDNNQKRLK